MSLLIDQAALSRSEPALDAATGQMLEPARRHLPEAVAYLSPSGKRFSFGGALNNFGLAAALPAVAAFAAEHTAPPP